MWERLKERSNVGYIARVETKDATKVKGKVLLEITCFLSARAVGDMINMGLMGKQRINVLVVTSL